MAAEINTDDPWATLDELLGIQVEESADLGLGDMAVYGRCSTEDNQDPETSHGWQVGNATKFVGPLGGRIVADYFDTGQSRSVPWERREAAGRLLAALKDPDRGWNALVVGEGTRCWFGNQFSLTAPKFAAYGVDLWVPELGGRYDPRNPSHKMLMSVLGGMSESERQHVQARVRAAMDAQVVNEGRHQGGRAPYGYVTVDGGPHPNPRKAAEGYRLRVLEIDEPAAEVVRRIFADYLNGKGDRAIAEGLNRDGIPCPSARRPEQNSHRLADGWQGGTTRAILDNPRYTGYAVFGRFTKYETLLNPEDVAAGHVVRFRRAEPDQVVRSRKPAHPAIVSVEVFTETQLKRKARAAGGMRGRAKLERTRVHGTRPYALRGKMRCAICTRRMHGAVIRGHEIYYRCLARSLAPGSAVLATHPRTVNVREVDVLRPVNEWLGRKFARPSLDETVAELLGSQDTGPDTSREAARERLAEVESRLHRLQSAIEAGVDPTALVDAINAAQAERAAVRAEVDRAPRVQRLTKADVHAMRDMLGDVGKELNRARPESLERLYDQLGLDLRFLPGENAVEVTAVPRVVSVCVRGGT
jgi:DNA invertase Pin-like site-specific DNA recombinase